MSTSQSGVSTRRQKLLDDDAALLRIEQSRHAPPRQATPHPSQVTDEEEEDEQDDTPHPSRPNLGRPSNSELPPSNFEGPSSKLPRGAPIDPTPAPSIANATLEDLIKYLLQAEVRRSQEASIPPTVEVRQPRSNFEDTRGPEAKRPEAFDGRKA